MKTADSWRKCRRALLTMVCCFVLAAVLLPATAQAAIPTLKANQRKTFTGKHGHFYNFQFKADRTGYIDVYTTGVYNAQLRSSTGSVISLVGKTNSDLYFGDVLPSTFSGTGSTEGVDAAKSAVSGQYVATFAVKKGKTYRLRLMKTWNGKSQVLYKIRSLSVTNNIYKSRAKRIQNTGKVKQQIYGKKTYWLSYKLDDKDDYGMFEIAKICHMAEGEVGKLTADGLGIEIEKHVKPEIAITVYTPHGKQIAYSDTLGGNVVVQNIYEDLECGTYLIKLESKKSTNSGYIEFYFDRKG